MCLSLCAFLLVPLVQGCVVSTLGQLEILWVGGWTQNLREPVDISMFLSICRYPMTAGDATCTGL